MDITLVKIECKSIINNSEVLLSADVFIPKKMPDGDYICSVVSKDANKLHFDVHGISAEQSLRLAFDMISSYMSRIYRDEILDLPD